MDLENARTIIIKWNKENFGQLLDVRELAVVRRATGKHWESKLYCSLSEGDVFVGTMVIDDDGQIIKVLSVDEFVDALVTMRIANAKDAPGFVEEQKSDGDFSTLADEFSDFSLDDTPLQNEPDDGFNNVFGDLETVDVQEKVNNLLATGEREKIMEARDLLPKLLSNADTRGAVLQQMGSLELLIGELELGTNYLEAAAREYTDVANIDALNQVAELSYQVLGDERFMSSPVKLLLDRSKARLRPLKQLREAPLFMGMGHEEMFILEGAAKQMTITSAEDLLKEGQLATWAFVVKSGLLSIRLETPEGKSQIVRSCYPGDFIGEMSVLGEPGATTTATVRGERLSTLWKFEGLKIREIIKEYPEVAMRIESARTLHRLDSFLSMHESTKDLDTSTRDQLLSCINGISRVSTGTVLNKAGTIPENVYLIAEGKVEYRVGEQSRIYEADTFAGLRDALHELAVEGEFIAMSDCLLVKFDPTQLRIIAQNATTEVVAVLEKME